MNTATMTYYPYGEPWSQPTGQPWLFGGKEREQRHHLGDSDFGARTYNAARATFAQPDPLCEKFYPINPYTFCAADPINHIDPTGMDIYVFDEMGNLTNKEKDSEKDIISIKYKEDHIVSTEPMEFGTIQSYRKYNNGNGGYYNIMQVDGAVNGREIFEFFAENTNIEFGIFITGEKGKGPSFITTSHEKGGESAGYWLFKNQLRFGYHIVSRSHNHPGSSDVSEPDEQIADQITDYLGGRRIKFNIYRKMPNPYNPNEYEYEYTSY